MSLELSFNIDTLDEKKGTPGKFKTEKLKDGLSYYRILPPFGTDHNGAISHQYVVHWGFIGANGKDRSYSCSRPTEGFCPVCQNVWDTKDELERAKNIGDEALIKELDKWVAKYSAKKSYILNACSLDGRLVRLELASTANEGLNARIKGVAMPSSSGVIAYDPVDVDTGVWFEFNRQGKGLLTRYSVDIRRTMVNVGGEQLSKPDRSPLPIPEDVIQQIKEQALAAKKGEMIDGPLSDIHTMHEKMSSTELRELLEGVLPTKSTPVSRSAPTTSYAPKIVPKTATAAPASTAPVSPAELGQEMDRLKRLQLASDAGIPTF